MKLTFDVLRPGEPDAGITETVNTVTVEFHDVADDESEFREVATEIIKGALAGMFDVPERSVFSEEETKKIEQMLCERGEREAEGE